jgi:uncharacterized lipoprotein YbaY
MSSRTIRGQITANAFAPDGVTPGRPLEASTKVKIDVQDVSLADAPSKTLGNIELNGVRSFPINYEVEFNDAPIMDLPRGQYCIQVFIETDGRLDYWTDSRHSIVKLTDTDSDEPIVEISENLNVVVTPAN